MLSQALHASFTESADQRATDRRVLRLEAQAATPAGDGGIRIHNLSRTGMLAAAAAAVPVGTSIEVEMPGGARHSAEVVWRDAELFGCRFDKPLSQATLSAALLRATPLAIASDVAAAQLASPAFARLREHWEFEAEAHRPGEPKLALGQRLWIILGLGLAGWAIPGALALSLS